MDFSEDGTMAKTVSFVAVVMAMAVAIGVRGEQTGQAIQEPASILRSAGPTGLDRILSEYDALRKRVVDLEKESAEIDQRDVEGRTERLAAIDRQRTSVQEQIKNLELRIDEIGGQRGCSVSRLYWYTDLEAAKAAAEASGPADSELANAGQADR